MVGRFIDELMKTAGENECAARVSQQKKTTAMK
jgi:hypothetical protein